MERTLDLVAAMVRLGPAGLTQLADTAGCTRANAFRILRTLELRGLAVQEGRRGAWRLGPGWLTFARAAEREGALAAAAAPAMAALASRSAEPVALHVRDGEQAVVAATHPASPPGLYRVAQRWPLHAGPGHVLLAYAPAPIQAAVLASRLPRLASATRTRPESIAADLPHIRTREWLITSGEVAEGIVTVSTVVRDQPGDVVAVLTVASPALRMRPPRPHTLLPAVVEAATAIRQAL